jgi:AAA+ superfamily predicted ATPase
MKPSNAQKTNEWEVWKNLYIDPLINKKSSRKNKKTPLLRPGDAVRLSHLRNIFQRDYHEKWTGEHFYITEAIMRDGIPVYKVKDYAGDPITGTFYSSELQHIKPADNQLYKIEKIIGKKTARGKQEVLVKWLNWPAKYNTWLPKSQVEKYR